MIICSQCGNIIRDNLSFCDDCGAEVPVVAGNPAATGTGNPYLTAPTFLPNQMPAVASVQPLPAQAAPDLAEAPAKSGGGKPVAFFIAGGVLGLAGVLVVIYFTFFSFSAKKVVLAQVKAGNLVKPEVSSA